MSRCTYAYVGASVREAHARAVEAGDLVGRDWRVLMAVVALVATYSRTSDKLTAQQIAEAAGMDVRHASRSLARLVDRDIIAREATVGRRPSATGFPSPRPEFDHTADHEQTTEPWPQTASVATGQPWPRTASVEGSEPWPQTASVEHRNPGQNGHSTLAADGQAPEKNSEKKALRARSATSSGSAGGRPTSPTDPLEGIANPRLRGMLMRVVKPIDDEPGDPALRPIEAITA